VELDGEYYADAKDLLQRMSREVVARIVRNPYKQKVSPADNLPAGIAYWTLERQASELGTGNAAKLHKLAEHYLVKASSEGDLRARSFAALALAMCSEASSPGGKQGSALYRDSKRRKRTLFLTRLRSVAKTYEKSVPLRARQAKFLINITS